MSENIRRTNGKSATIGCDAANCSYHGESDSCTAEHIKVGGKRARSTGETCCTTFRPKNG